LMRRLAFVLLLAACQMQAGTEGRAPSGVSALAEDVIEVTPLAVAPPTEAAALPTAPVEVTPEVAPPTEAAALPTAPEEATPEVAPPTERGVVTPEEAACQRGGGQWAKVGAAGRICLRQTRQGGKSCEKKSDCKGECLAQSGTCSPIRPLMGCNEVMDNEGRRMTQCLQ
jgi:putative hemolysin